MSFVRIKKISGKSYAYLVQNKWRKRLPRGKKGSRQKVSKYLGKVVSYPIINKVDFSKYSGMETTVFLKKDKKAIVRDLVSWELSKRGFERKDNLLYRDKITFDMDSRKFIDKNGDEQRIVIEMNEGFLCKRTIRDLLYFKSSKEDEREQGIDLAKAFLEAGVNVPKDIFVGYYEKI